MTFDRLLRVVLLIGWSAVALPVFAGACEVAEVEPRVLMQEVEAQLQGLGGAGLELELEPIGTLPRLSRPSVRVLSRGLRSRVAVELTGEACGRRQVSTVWFKLRAYREAWVYGLSAKAGRPLAEAHPRRERVDLAGAQLQPGDLAEELQGLWLVQDVRAGMPVLARQLQAEPLVKRDEMVRVVVRGPGLMVSTQGKAMRPGMLGDNVPVLLDGASSSLPAVVAGKGEVHVGQQ
ncbi:flagellar basal body P-ring formation chaperone FlgA [Pseudomonas sp. CAU 1711]|uniref:flagellar basal body P-ring formation chaperone FlgA n=1 Tax=Pseudomonas sp. CAU 1711 TaxID=3140356 RepID=UPI0032600F02